jgi:type IV pilus assembly protein PilW
MDASIRRQSGFNLIELMVGLTISLIGLIAVAQIMVTFNQQRTTVGQTMASQNNGVMALYLLERDLAQAGYGLMNLQNCLFINYFYNGTGYYLTPYGVGLPGTNNVALTTLPVRIIDGGTGSDILEVQYGYSASGVPGTDITGVQASYSDAYAVKAAVGFATGDRFVANVNGTCTLAEVSNANPVVSPIAHDAGPAAPYNVAAAPGGTGWNNVLAAYIVPNVSPQPFLANLGSFVSRRYQIDASGLTLAELPTFTANTLVDDIVFFKAQYGLAASAASSSVASWADGSTIINNTTASRVIAIRVGIVARSPLYEKTEVDAPATLSVIPPRAGVTVLPDPAAGLCGTDATTSEVKCTVTDRHYRYRAYSTVVPLKNSIWIR